MSLKSTLTELVLLARISGAALSARYNSEKIKAHQHDLEKALRTYDDLYARLSWVRYEDKPGIPEFLRKQA